MNGKSPKCVFRAQLMSLAFGPRPADQRNREEMALMFFVAGADHDRDESGRRLMVRGSEWPDYD